MSPGSWEQVDRPDIQQWMTWLLDRYSSAYASNQYRALQQFFRCWRPKTITCPDLPDGFDVWVHFSAIEMGRYDSLNADGPVESGCEPAGQHSFRFVAASVRKR
jgi:CspA family cold shock protein